MIAAGKAATAMAAAAGRALGARVRGGISVSIAAAGVPPLEALAAGHPVPTASSEVAGRRALAIATEVTAGEQLLVLLSGGASALMAVPAEGLRLDDKQRTTELLLRAGADIHALNTVRKHLSGIKGGRLAASAVAPNYTLAISDVIGDDPSTIASGPTVADPSTFEDALDVLRRFGGHAVYPAPVVSHLVGGTRGEHLDTPKPGDNRLSAARTFVIGGRFDAMRGAAEEAACRGYHAVTVEPPIAGEARAAGPSLIRAIAEQPAVRPLAVISSGETTVRVAGGGRGGRNQELALAAAAHLPSLGLAALASVGTDGADGPTPAAGAIVDCTTVERARRAQLPDLSTFLIDNNSHAFFEALGDLIHTGPTGTNVGDLQVLLLV
jgi:hydroxypyruvate reductase